MNLDEFIDLSPTDIARIISIYNKPKTVCLMVDGTRRLAKITPANQHYSNNFDAEAATYRSMLKSVLNACSFLWSCGIESIIGPIASKKNFSRHGFVENSLRQLLCPLFEEDAQAIFKEHSVCVRFYFGGDLPEFLRDALEPYVALAAECSAKSSRRNLLIGVGFDAVADAFYLGRLVHTLSVAQCKAPTLSDLKREIFGFDIPEVDIFIRTAEFKLNGGVHPLLCGGNMQLYFIAAAGALGINDIALRRILYDFIYSRVTSNGAHERQSLPTEVSGELFDFYDSNKALIFGCGQRVGDVWIARDPFESALRQMHDAQPCGQPDLAHKAAQGRLP